MILTCHASSHLMFSYSKAVILQRNELLSLSSKMADMFVHSYLPAKKSEARCFEAIFHFSLSLSLV